MEEQLEGKCLDLTVLVLFDVLDSDFALDCLYDHRLAIDHPRQTSCEHGPPPNDLEIEIIRINKGIEMIGTSLG